MRVVHISWSTGGGAGTAALRLHTGLLRRGVDSHFLCVTVDADADNVTRIQRERFLQLREALGRLGIPATHEARHRWSIRFRPGEHEAFSSPRSDFDLSRHPLVRGADVVNLHWVSGLIDCPTFFERVHKPIVWTLHDANPFQGGFHYASDRERNAAKYGALEESLRGYKQRCYARAKRLAVVGPSQWIVKRSQDSRTFGNAAHHCIPYGVDTDVFRPQPRAMCRAIFNLAPDKPLFLYVSSAIANRRKGLEPMLAALRALRGQADANTVAVGIGKPPAEMLSVGHVGDARLMGLLMAAADAVVVPSLEDNLPNVLLESLACGTPIIGFPVGGIPEAVESGSDGLITRSATADALAESMLAFLENPAALDRDRIRQRAVERFALDVQAGRYLALYRGALRG